ncbi:hypothetical protein EMPS_02731 [Entomortierella parvispora]|uniref:Uncharacterized protein n=1 Tax=Entomortierella parvispora TaxID=205924 RepID=A0A9P3H603_9FUNG|nr:hypothetical protein EMPS_02731 [Entomortierella parvispora]
MQGDQQGQRLRWTKDVHPGLVSGPTAIASFSKHWEGVGSYESRDPMLVQDAMMDLAASLIPPEVTPGMWREDGNRSMTTTGQTGKRQLSHPVLDTYNQDLCLRPRQRRRKQAPHADNLTPDKSSTSPLLESKR